MIERWFLYYDNACPICLKTKQIISNLELHQVRLTIASNNTQIAKTLMINKDEITLVTAAKHYYGFDAVCKIISRSRYKWMASFGKPLLFLSYICIALIRHVTKSYGKILKKNKF